MFPYQAGLGIQSCITRHLSELRCMLVKISDTPLVICITPLVASSGNGLSPVQHHTIAWTNASISSIRPLWRNFRIETQPISFMQTRFSFIIHLKKSPVKWPPFFPGGGELKCEISCLYIIYMPKAYVSNSYGTIHCKFGMENNAKKNHRYQFVKSSVYFPLKCMFFVLASRIFFGDRFWWLLCLQSDRDRSRSLQTYIRSSTNNQGDISYLFCFCYQSTTFFLQVL